MPDEAEARRYSALVIEAESGMVLHAEDPDAEIYPASLTKMMTLYLLFEAVRDNRYRLDSQLPVSRRATQVSPSKFDLKEGERISVEAAILGLVTKSANDVAVVVAEALGSSEANFGKMMTAKARAIGMRNTTFRNASGLPNQLQRSTARDMATLAQRLMTDFPDFYRYFSQRDYTYRGRSYTNHNKLLTTFKGTDGIKTGYIRASGFNLVASAVRDGRRIIGVVVGARTGRLRDARMEELLSQGFDTLAAANKPRPSPKPRPLLVSSGADVRADTNPSAAPADGKIATVARALAARGALDDTTAPSQTDGTALAALAEEGSAPSDSAPTAEWAIQVGAFRTIAPARKAARQALTNMPHLSERSRVAIMPFDNSGTLFYRARVVGFTEAHAQAACHKLASRRMECVPIAPTAAD